MSLEIETRNGIQADRRYQRLIYNTQDHNDVLILRLGDELGEDPQVI